MYFDVMSQTGPVEDPLLLDATTPATSAQFEFALRKVARTSFDATGVILGANCGAENLLEVARQIPNVEDVIVRSRSLRTLEGASQLSNLTALTVDTGKNKNRDISQVRNLSAALVELRYVVGDEAALVHSRRIGALMLYGGARASRLRDWPPGLNVLTVALTHLSKVSPPARLTALYLKKCRSLEAVSPPDAGAISRVQIDACPRLCLGFLNTIAGLRNVQISNLGRPLCLADLRSVGPDVTVEISGTPLVQPATKDSRFNIGRLILHGYTPRQVEEAKRAMDYVRVDSQ